MTLNGSCIRGTPRGSIVYKIMRTARWPMSCGTGSPARSHEMVRADKWYAQTGAREHCCAKGGIGKHCRRRQCFTDVTECSPLAVTMLGGITDHGRVFEVR